MPINGVIFFLLVISIKRNFHSIELVLNFLIYILLQVGADEFGYMLADILKENHVDNSGMRFDTHARTALAFVTLRADGEREFMFFRNPSADMLLTEAELDKDLIHKVNKHVFLFCFLLIIIVVISSIICRQEYFTMGQSL